jgi:putative MATE family efflux protein
VLTIIGILLTDQMIWLVGAKDDTFEMAASYFHILLLGIPLNNLSLTISAAQRGIGSTRTSMIINMAANLVNLVLNFLLIGGRLGFPALGVKGAAIATVIGWSVGLVFALVSVLHRQSYFYIVGREGWRPDRQTFRAIYIVASGTFLEQICMRIGFLANTMVSAGLGTMMFAAHNICSHILSLSFSFGEGFGIAATSLSGQNLGAKRPDLSIMYGKVCQRYSFITSAAMMFLFVFQGGTLTRLFSSEPDIIAVCRTILLIAAVVLFGQSTQLIYMGSLRGAGDTRYTAIITLISVMLVRPVVAYVLAYPLGFGLTGIWLAFVVDQYTRLALCVRRFSSGKWMKIEL